MMEKIILSVITNIIANLIANLIMEILKFIKKERSRASGRGNDISGSCKKNEE